MAALAQPGAEVVVDSPPPISRLTEDLLADILLRLPALDDIGRAAAACPAFRDVVADPSFKRRLRRARRAPFVGFLFCMFHPAEAPHSSAPCARALERAADLSFSLLHSPQPFTRWYPLDARDGRVVLGNAWSGSFVVSDPLSRRCLLLPPLIPDPAVAAAVRQHPFLFPANGDDDDEPETAFKVGCMVEYEHEPGLVVAAAFVYRSATGEWSDLRMGATLPELKPFYACGCFYWKFTPDMVFVLDTRTMEFNIVGIPTLYGERDFVIAEAGEGRTGIFSLRHSDASASSSLICAVKNGEGDGVWWQFRRSIALPSQCRYTFAAASGRHLLLHGSPWHLHGTPPDEHYYVNVSGCGYFSVESDTLRIEKVCDLEPLVAAVPYTSFPPSLSLRSI